MDVIYPYTKNETILHDPEIEPRDDSEYGFAFHKPLSLADTRSVQHHEREPLVFQSVLMLRNARSDLSSLPPVPRSPDGNAVAFLDGHVERLPAGWKGYGP
jgi:prepilin-type processing-associated H-X9-DG protein